MSASEEAAAILVRVFESIARLNSKTLSASTRADIGRACELLANAGAELEDLLDDLPESPRRSPGEQAIGDPRFEAWRARRG